MLSHSGERCSRDKVIKKNQGGVSKWGVSGAWQNGSRSSGRFHFSQARTSVDFYPSLLESSTRAGHLNALCGSYRTLIKTGIAESF